MTALKDANFCKLTVMETESLRLKYKNVWRLFLQSSVFILDLQTRRKLMTWVASSPINEKNHSGTEICSNWFNVTNNGITKFQKILLFCAAIRIISFSVQYLSEALAFRHWDFDFSGTVICPLMWRVWCGNCLSAFLVCLYYWLAFLQVRSYCSQVRNSQEFNL
jgi:hypothetical protein